MTAAPIQLFLVDEDPVFRLGLRIWLEQREEFAIAGEASTAAETLTQLAQHQTEAEASATDAGRDRTIAPIDLVILDIGLGQGEPGQLAGLQLCGDIRQQFPTLPILVLSAYGEPVIQAAARQRGATGFGLRSLPVRDLARLIEHTAGRMAAVAIAEESPSVPVAPAVWSPITALRQSCLIQIDATIDQVNAQLGDRLSPLYRQVLNGKHRELRAARWLIQRILPDPPSQSRESQGVTGSPPPISPMPIASPGVGGGAIVPRAPAIPVAAGDVRTRVCEAVFRQLQFPLDNASDIPLEIDILRRDRGRELLYTTLRAFEDLLDDLQQANLPPGQLPDRVPSILQDLWQTVITQFFGRYYTPEGAGLEQPIVAILQQDQTLVYGEILSRIPQVPDLLGHLLYQEPLLIDGASYVATTPEALRRSQHLLENLLIQTACAVVQPLLNRLADVESIKRLLYQRRVISSRDIARFRNDLSWRYRWDTLIHEPRAIFESQHRLFVFSPKGIQTEWIYAHRQAELEQLSGLRYAVTLALEARDAIAPRLRAAIGFVGSGVVYVLTEVVGRGIGLVGRGILKGIGSAWHENRIRPRSRDKA
ncbi:MAG: DUF3685 domain-containing protein [Leptolyngbyaceae cyanobacterium T60_A2020_046]|nr:DUF3685 domain-containing protein [Leptolyngbyaceae cyanobacterium T60_A2020_046]